MSLVGTNDRQSRFLFSHCPTDRDLLDFQLTAVFFFCTPVTPRITIESCHPVVGPTGFTVSKGFWVKNQAKQRKESSQATYLHGAGIFTSLIRADERI